LNKMQVNISTCSLAVRLRFVEKTWASTLKARSPPAAEEGKHNERMVIGCQNGNHSPQSRYQIKKCTTRHASSCSGCSRNASTSLNSLRSAPSSPASPPASVSTAAYPSAGSVLSYSPPQFRNTHSRGASKPVEIQCKCRNRVGERTKASGRTVLQGLPRGSRQLEEVRVERRAQSRKETSVGRQRCPITLKQGDKGRQHSQK